jgi:integrase
MGKVRSGYVRERPSVFFALVTFTDESGKKQKIERQADSQKQAQQILKEILQGLSKRKEITVTSKRIRERRGGVFARVTFTDESGRRREIERRARNRTDAKEALKQILRDLDDHGEHIFDADQMSFADLTGYYEKNYLIEPQYVHGRKVAGLRSYHGLRFRLRTLRNYFGKRKLRAITHGDLKRFKVDRLKTPVVLGRNTRGTDKPGRVTTRQRSITTVNRELQLLRRVLNVAVSNGWIKRNPFELGDALITPGDEKKRERIITREEEARLLGACTGKREHLRPIIICALDTGMRKGEILKILPADVDIQNRIITVQAFNTKTMRERQVAMTERLARELKLLLRNLPEREEVPVFGMAEDFKRGFNTARKIAGMSEVRFHDLRHTHATRLVAAHVPLSEVGRALGHTQANTTFRYVNANVETARRVASVLDEFNRSVDQTEAEIID